MSQYGGNGAIVARPYSAPRRVLKDVVVRFPDNKLYYVAEIPRYCFTQQELDMLFKGEIVYPEKESFGLHFIGANKGRMDALKFCAYSSCWLQLGEEAKKHVRALQRVEPRLQLPGV